MKLAMSAVDKAMKDKELSAKMLLQVHDELIFEVPNEELEGVKALVKNTMENAFNNIMGVNISVPLEAEAGTGESWASAH